MKSSNLTKLHGTCQKLKWLSPQGTRSTNTTNYKFYNLNIYYQTILLSEYECGPGQSPPYWSVRGMPIHITLTPTHTYNSHRNIPRGQCTCLQFCQHIFRRSSHVPRPCSINIGIYAWLLYTPLVCSIPSLYSLYRMGINIDAWLDVDIYAIPAYYYLVWL